MRYAQFEELNTVRLKLRELKPDDADSFFQFASDEEVSRYMLWNPHKSIEDSKQSIETSVLRYEAGGYYRWGIALGKSDILIGIIQLLAFDEASESCSFAYMLGKEYWNQGYGTEALKAVLQFAFEKMRIQTVQADHFSENAASGKVMEKAGMTRCGMIPEKYRKDGESFDAVQYIANKASWNIQSDRTY